MKLPELLKYLKTLKLVYLDMAKGNKKTPKKKGRAKNYEPKFSIKGNFADVFKVIKQNKENTLNKQKPE